MSLQKKIADIIIFTDGASSGNPGPGGWGAVVAKKGSEVVEIGGGVLHTTNNRMELTAAIEALQYVATVAGVVVVYTDSKYVRDGIETWVPLWQKREWKTAAKTEVLNQDLWQRLAALVTDRKNKGSIMWRLVAGHKNVPANERVDTIATTFAAAKKPILFSGPSTTYTIDLTPFFNLEKIDTSFLGLDNFQNSKTKTKKKSGAPAYSYVSMVHGVIARHATWQECFERVRGVSGARFKKARSSEDEKNIIANFKSI